MATTRKRAIEERLQQIVIDPYSGVPSYQQLAEQMAELARNGALHAGLRLPEQLELVEHLHVGKDTVQAAMRLLRDLGVVDAQRGRGTFIARGVADNVKVLEMLVQREISRALCEARRRGVPRGILERVTLRLLEQIFDGDRRAEFRPEAPGRRRTDKA